MRTATPFLAALIGVLASAGCALPTARPVSGEALQQEPGWIFLEEVPAVEQVSDQGCGAACLAMVLRYWNHEATAEELEQECLVPGTEGILAASLREAAEKRGLSAYLFSGTVADLEYELQRGRPVIVGLASPRGDAYLSHFQVVVGLQPAEQRIAVLEPAVGHLMRSDLADFEAQWSPTHRVMLVMFEPEPEATTALLTVPRTGDGR